ncbi:MAG TPA: 16S rRNA (cytidine(1402)-2'-O)-methyltransferase [Vicinamibacterales bacterium]|nr:16S rRNA (cytidine(1402)-2'-O)-methyltransferase [Vicinamibacterales bacterium]
MTGTLFVVATPIGNLEDLTFRALRVLREADLIAAEDTRRTSKLLAHYEIRKSMISLHEHNEHREAPRLVERIQAGATVALVTDAGTPGISDPGAKLVAAAREAGVHVVAVPGPSAVTAALSVTGLETSTFLFLGFPPPSGAARSKWMERLKAEPGPVVFFEAPHRIRRTIADLTGVVERPIFVHRELTKIHETYVLRPKTANIPEKGEFVVVVGSRVTRGISAETQMDPAVIFRFAACLVGLGVVDANDVPRLVGKAFDLDERAVPKLLKKGRYLVNQQTNAEP